MQYNIPMTKQQKEFEDMIQVFIKIMSELTEEERKRIFDFVIFTYNK